MSRITVEGAIDEIPRDGPLILAANHASNLDAVVLGSWLIPTARPADPLARQEGAVRLADRRLGGGERRRPPGRPRRGGRRGLPAGPAHPRRGPRPVRLPGGDAQPGRRAPGGPGRGRGAGAARRARRSSRSGSPARTASGRGARSCRARAATSRVRVGRPFRPADELAAGHRPADGEGPRHDRDHGPHRRPPAAVAAWRLRVSRDARATPVHAGRRRVGPVGSTRTPCDNRSVGTVQEVRIAKRTGFCYGVREAIDKAKEASAAGKATHTLGQVVHNEGVVRDLQDLGHPDRRHRSTTSTTAPRSSSAPTACRPDVMERAEAARPRGHRRHLHLGHPGAERARASSSRRATRSSCSARRSTPRSSACSASRPTRSSSTRRRSGRPRSRAASGWRSSARSPSRPGSSRSSPRSWSRGPTSSRSSTPSARSRSAASRTRSSRPARST